MQATPAHDQHNPDLLQMMPLAARRIVEVGCSSGALAREYKKLNSTCHYLGIEVVAEYEALARQHCDEVIHLDLEAVGEDTVTGFGADCWVFGDVLEHLRDPWELLRKVRAAMPPDGHVVACIPNAQHWSVQARLGCGELRYEDSGLLDRTHLRWFTRITIIEMFQQAGFRIVNGRTRKFIGPDFERFRPALELMARCAGVDVNQALEDAQVFQYVIDVVPA